jgi:hypothetical protein
LYFIFNLNVIGLYQVTSYPLSWTKKAKKGMLHNEDYAHDETHPHYESIGSDIVIFSAESNLGALKPRNTIDVYL